MDASNSRQTFGIASAAVMVVMAAVGAPAQAQTSPDLKGKSFVFASFGGDLQKNEDAAWLQPFTTATGVKIEQTSSPDLATLKTQQEAQNVGEDVLEIESSTVDSSCGSVFMKVEIDRSQINPAYDKNKCGVPVVKFSLVLAYNSKKYPKPPTSVADFLTSPNFLGPARLTAAKATRASWKRPWKPTASTARRSIRSISIARSQRSSR